MATSSSSIVTPKPFFTRVSYSIQLWAIKLIVQIIVRLKRYRNPLPASNAPPTSIKHYPGPLQHLENRIFLPPVPLTTKKLPLYISIHGGGFVFGNPSDDDEINFALANRAGIIVVSINYRKAPQWKFPTAVNDVAALVEAVIADDSLNVDKDRVAIGGFSAGGNLSLAVSQLPALREKIKAVVPWYAPLTFDVPTQQKVESRQYRKPGEKDMLRPLADLFNWAYMPVGTDAREPLLSVAYVDRGNFPNWVYVIACEYDMLGIDSRILMEGLTGEKDLGYEFEKGGLKFVMLKGCFHAFTNMKLKGEDEVVRVQAVEKCLDGVSEWLWKGAFA